MGAFVARWRRFGQLVQHPELSNIASLSYDELDDGPLHDRVDECFWGRASCRVPPRWLGDQMKQGVLSRVFGVDPRIAKAPGNLDPLLQGELEQVGREFEFRG